MPKCKKKWGSFLIIIIILKWKKEREVHCFSLDETTLLYYVFHADRDMHSVDIVRFAFYCGFKTNIIENFYD